MINTSVDIQQCQGLARYVGKVDYTWISRHKRLAIAIAYYKL